MRRLVWAAVLVSVGQVLPGGLAAGAPPSPFGFDDVKKIAAEVAAKPYVSPEKPMPPGAAKLNYDAYRNVRFRRDRALWNHSGTLFRVHLFSRGWLFKVPVTLDNVPPGGRPSELEYSPSLFEAKVNDKVVPMPEGVGFSGFRIMEPLNDPDVLDELIVFQGASYFRALGRHQVYGASARSLAIDTGTDHEEFPNLTRFWLLQPKPGEDSVTLLGLLDGPSVAGAYQYVVKPGDDTTVTVTAELHARRGVEKLGLAPITSMFLYGKISDHHFPDFRPEVHDSDGLLVHDEAGRDAWSWRPLNNPKQMQTIEQPVKKLAGFGLLQRERRFDHYEDLEANYHRRPSVWIEPLDDWGPGCVELFELPSDLEYNDNANAYWVPATPMKAGDVRTIRYRIHWLSGDPSEPVARCTGAWQQPLKSSDDGREGQWIETSRFIVDFAGPTLSKLPIGTVPELWVDADKGKVTGARAEANPYTGGWRLVFEIDPQGAKVVNLRAGFARANKPLSETWSHRWDR